MQSGFLISPINALASRAVVPFLSKCGKARSSKPLGTRLPLMACWPTHAIIWEMLMLEPAHEETCRLMKAQYIYQQPITICIYGKNIQIKCQHFQTIVTVKAQYIYQQPITICIYGKNIQIKCQHFQTMRWNFLPSTPTSAQLQPLHLLVSSIFARLKTHHVQVSEHKNKCKKKKPCIDSMCCTPVHQNVSLHLEHAFKHQDSMVHSSNDYTASRTSNLIPLLPCCPRKLMISDDFSYFSGMSVDCILLRRITEILCSLHLSLHFLRCITLFRLWHHSVDFGSCLLFPDIVNLVPINMLYG